MVKKAKNRRRKSTKKRIIRTKKPQVTVAVPKGTKVKVVRKPKNPYYVEVDERDGKTGKKQIWYTPDYQKKH